MFLRDNQVFYLIFSSALYTESIHKVDIFALVVHNSSRLEERLWP